MSIFKHFCSFCFCAFCLCKFFFRYYRLCFFDSQLLIESLLHFPFVIVGKHSGFANCDIRFGREITVELDSPTMLQYDGEVIDGVSGYTARK